MVEKCVLIAAHLRVLMLLSLYVPLRIASSISCIFFKLSSPSAYGGGGKMSILMSIDNDTPNVNFPKQRAYYRPIESKNITNGPNNMRGDVKNPPQTFPVRLLNHRRNVIHLPAATSWIGFSETDEDKLKCCCHGRVPRCY